jgi:hypothetical protein
MSFWILVGISVLAAGSLTAGLESDPGPVTGLRVAGSGLVLVAAMTLAGRVMVGLSRARRRTDTSSPR